MQGFGNLFWMWSLRGLFAAPTPALPHGGGGCLVLYIHIERSGVCKWAMSHCDVFAALTSTPFSRFARTLPFSQRRAFEWRCNHEVCPLTPPQPSPAGEAIGALSRLGSRCERGFLMCSKRTLLYAARENWQTTLPWKRAVKVSLNRPVQVFRQRWGKPHPALYPLISALFL